MGNMQGTQEHDDMARAIASVVGKRKKRPGLELGWKREGGRHYGCIPPPPGSTSYSLAPLLYPGPLRFHLSCSASGPSGSF